MDTINNVVTSLVKDFRGVVGVGFKDLETGKEFYFNGDKQFLTASVFKIFVIIELYNQAIRGIVNLDERYTLSETDKVLGSGILQEMQEGLQPTIRDLAKLMMILSDNTATDTIINIVGKENINKTIQEVLGLKNSKVMLTTGEILLDIAGAQDWKTARKNFEEMKINKNGRWATDFRYNDITTPKEMVKTLELLYKKEILTSEACEEIINIMKSCQTGGARIKRFLPENVKVAHKTGTMPGVVNDAGIIFTPKGDYILVVFINRLDYETQPYVAIGEDLISQISKTIYESFVC